MPKLKKKLAALLKGRGYRTDMLLGVPRKRGAS